MSELGFRPPYPIRVQMDLPAYGLCGLTNQHDPYTIHLSPNAYQQGIEHVVFHEAKHVYDILTHGYSDESTPNPFASQLCRKYGFRDPSMGVRNLVPIQRQEAALKDQVLGKTHLDRLQ